MEAEAMEADCDNGGRKRVKCLFCNENVPCKDEGQEGISLLGQRDTVSQSRESATGEDLKSQLSTFFMFRKVLCLSPEFLENLLKTCGSPSQWEVRLCRPCRRLFKEAEHLWDRMCQLQRDYENVTFEIKDTLVSSMSPEEIKNLNDSVDEASKEALVEGKVKSCQVVEAARVKFFIDLQDEQNDTVTRGGLIPIFSSEGTKVNSDKLRWNDKGVPYLSLADFENKMKALVETVVAAQHELKTDNPVPSLQHKERSNIDFINNGKENVEFDQNNTQEGPLKENSCENTITSNTPSPVQDVVTIDSEEEEEQEPLIRIVQTNTLMESEDADDEDNDAFPHVEAILKQDVDDNDEEILVINDDDDDPDYVPENEPTSKTYNMPHKSKKRKINYFSIKVVRKAPSVFECSKCLGTFGARLGCQIHILRDHFGETSAFFHCHICEEKFTLNHALRHHVYSSHKRTQTAYDDDYNSDESESTSSREKDHHRRPSSQDQSDPQTNTLIFECPLEECLDKFTNKRDLQTHTRTVHGNTLSKLKLSKKKKPDPPPGLECAICAKRNIEYKAVNLDILEFHYKKVHNGCVDIRSQMKAKIIRRMQPVVARKSTTPKSSRSTSMKCPECGKVLPDSATMAEHIKNPENKCPDCPKHFNFKVDLDHHLELDHYSRNFNCPYCTKSFKSQTIYEKHIENHQSFDMHECEVCHLKITGYVSLSNHTRHAHPEFFEQQEQLQQQQGSKNPEIFGL